MCTTLPLSPAIVRLVTQGTPVRLVCSRLVEFDMQLYPFYYCARLFSECPIIVSKGKCFYIFGTFFILILSQLVTLKGYNSICTYEFENNYIRFYICVCNTFCIPMQYYAQYLKFDIVQVD